MNRVWVRPIRPDESQMFLDWSLENKDKSAFDSQVPLYPSSTTWCAYDKDGPLAYQTLQRPIMLESLAPRPGASPVQISSSLKELTQNTITFAHSIGAGEVYFLSSDPETSKFAANKIFEEVPMKVYRFKLSDLQITSNQ